MFQSPSFRVMKTMNAARCPVQHEYEKTGNQAAPAKAHPLPRDSSFRSSLSNEPCAAKRHGPCVTRNLRRVVKRAKIRPTNAARKLYIYTTLLWNRNLLGRRGRSPDRAVVVVVSRASERRKTRRNCKTDERAQRRRAIFSSRPIFRNRLAR